MFAEKSKPLKEAALKKQTATMSIYLSSYWLTELDSAKVCGRQISEEERFLLELDDSLTQTLKNKARSEISVRLLTQEERSNLESYEIARLGHADKYFFREIYLESKVEPLVLARSITIGGSETSNLLSGLGTNPLGTLLFNSADWDSSPSRLKLETVSGIFGRSTLWRNRRTKELLAVQEFFLPALLKCDVLVS